MIRKHKLYTKPKKAYEKSRIEDENKIVEKYGLKNKREIWKTAAKVNYFRRRAKALARESSEEQEVLFNKLKNLGLKTHSIADVLALTAEDLLTRRLQTILMHKKLANTMKHARQMIVHKKVMINGNYVNSPGYLVSVSEENHLTVKQIAKKPKAEEPAGENK